MVNIEGDADSKALQCIANDRLEEIAQRIFDKAEKLIGEKGF